MRRMLCSGTGGTGSRDGGTQSCNSVPFLIYVREALIIFFRYTDALYRPGSALPISKERGHQQGMGRSAERSREGHMIAFECTFFYASLLGRGTKFRRSWHSRPSSEGVTSTTVISPLASHATSSFHSSNKQTNDAIADRSNERTIHFSKLTLDI